MKKPLLLMILDGFAICDNEKRKNAIKTANTSNLDNYFANYPFILIGASGEDVGLPSTQPGNSEVGHTAIGSGRIIYQDLVLISKTIKDGKIKDNEMIKKIIDLSKKENKNIHLMGLLSDGGVHSHIEHTIGLLDVFKDSGCKNTYIHAFLDGRDVHQTSGVKYLKTICDYINKNNFGSISSISGRFYSMDRNNNWDRTKDAYLSLIHKSEKSFSDPIDYINNLYNEGITDEFVYPSYNVNSKPISEGDIILFFNFRNDRAKQLTESFCNSSFNKFNTSIKNVDFFSMTNYDDKFTNIGVLFNKQEIKNGLGEYLSKLNKKQLRIAETEKYAHVTYFFNGGSNAEPFKGEDRVLIDSKDVDTYDKVPAMSCREIVDKLYENINNNDYDLIVLNFANCDMVGHTGNFEKAVEAVQFVDESVKKVVDLINEKGGLTIITADHGNADVMLDDNDNVVTSHSKNPVPFCIIDKDIKLTNDHGTLRDIAPTILDLMNIEKPKEMDGNSLIQH